jgi:hypothetical protein
MKFFGEKIYWDLNLIDQKKNSFYLRKNQIIAGFEPVTFEISNRYRSAIEAYS